MTQNKPEWYAVKGLFRWYFKESGNTSCVEERVVLFLAESFDAALNLAEAEADTYCQEDESANFKIEPMGWWNAYWIGEDMIASGVEIYSRLMDTSLTKESFLKHYYPKAHDHKA